MSNNTVSPTGFMLVGVCEMDSRVQQDNLTPESCPLTSIHRHSSPKQRNWVDAALF